MSAHLGFEGLGIGLGSSVAAMRDVLKNAITSYGWRCVRGSHTGALIAAVLGDVTNPANLFDFDPSSYSTTATLPRWAGVRATGAVAVDKVAIGIYQSGAVNGLKAFSLDWSDDGSSWTTHETWSNIVPWSNYELREFKCGSTPGAHLYWRVRGTDVQSGSNWNCSSILFYTSDGSWIAPYEYIDLIPPASEALGDSSSDECIRMRFPSDGLSLGIEVVLNKKVGIKQMHRLYEGTAGATAYAVTIGGTTVTQSVTNAAWTAKQNLRQLYYDLRASGAADVTAWDFTYQAMPPQNADDSNDYILMTRKAVGLPVSVTTNASVNGLPIASPKYPGTIDHMFAYPVSITVDLVAGWFYYLQVNARAFQIASKTNVNTFGAIFAWFRPNADAVAYCPESSNLCSLSEACVGWHGEETPTSSGSQNSYLRPGHFFAIPSKSFNATPSTSYTMNFVQAAVRGVVMDYVFQPSPVTTNYGYAANASGVFGLGTTTMNVANDYQVHTAVHANPQSYISNTNDGALAAWYPAAVLDSIYKFIGTATQEVTQLLQDSQTSTTLSSAIAAGDVMAGSGVVQVASTALFPAAGFFIINGEAFEYTAKTATTFTGVTRARYASVAANHYTSDKVYLGQWFVKINGSALLAGNVRPS